MRRLVTLGLCASALATSALAQPSAPAQLPSLPVQHPAQAITPQASSAPVANAPVLIRHGHVYTVAAAGTLSDADVLIENGKIAAVGPSLPQPAGAIIIDARGKPVTPGLMASYTQLGIEEIDLVHET